MCNRLTKTNKPFIFQFPIGINFSPLAIYRNFAQNMENIEYANHR